MRWLWAGFGQRRRSVETAGPRFTGTLVQVIGGRAVVVGGAGRRVPTSTPARFLMVRDGRGSLRGRVRISATFDGPRVSIAEAFGVR